MSRRLLVYVFFLVLFLLGSAQVASAADDSPTFEDVDVASSLFEALRPVLAILFTAIVRELWVWLRQIRQEAVLRLGQSGFLFVQDLLLQFIRAADQYAKREGWSNERRREWVVTRVLEVLQSTPLKHITRKQVEELLESAFRLYKEQQTWANGGILVTPTSAPSVSE